MNKHLLSTYTVAGAVLSKPGTCKAAAFKMFTLDRTVLGKKLCFTQGLGGAKEDIKIYIALVI